MLKFHDPYDVEAADLACGDSREDLDDVDLSLGVAGEALPPHMWDHDLRPKSHEDVLTWAERILTRTEQRWLLEKHGGLGNIRNWLADSERTQWVDWSDSDPHSRGGVKFADVSYYEPPEPYVKNVEVRYEPGLADRVAYEGAHARGGEARRHWPSAQQTMVAGFSARRAMINYLAELYGKGRPRTPLIKLANRVGFEMTVQDWKNLSRNWQLQRKKEQGNVR